MCLNYKESTMTLKGDKLSGFNPEFNLVDRLLHTSSHAKPHGIGVRQCAGSDELTLKSGSSSYQCRGTALTGAT